MTTSSYLAGFRCMQCETEHSRGPFRYTCPACGQNLDILLDYHRIRRNWSQEMLSRDGEPSLWRYLPLLPVADKPENLSLRVGGTPLVSRPDIAAAHDLANVFFKDDTRLPSGSLKDRASEVAIRHAREQGKQVLVAASTGNAAASLSALAAFHGATAVIIAPASAPVAKLTQIQQSGAVLCLVEGSYDQAFDLSIRIREKYDWYGRSTGINPILSEGKKTVALEIAEQLDWRVPDWIFVPAGDGCITGGVYKGFADLLELGWIDSLPHIVAVQAEGSAAIVDALNLNREIQPTPVATVADSIAVSMPRDGLKALRAVHSSGGIGIKVSDEAILQAQHYLAGDTGIFGEPAAAAAYAGFLRCSEDGRLASGDTAVVLVTGSGLKDIPAANRILASPEAIQPDLGAFDAFITRQSRSGALHL